MTAQPTPTIAPDAAREAELLHRLRRLEGQVRGIQRMIAERRACQEIIMQLAAIRSAVDQVGIMVLEDQLGRCLPPPADGEPPETLALRETLQLWTRFGRS